MITLITLTIVLTLLSVKSIAFLKTYIVLLQLGIRTNGKIIAFEESRHTMTKGLIPKVEFQTDDNQSVIAKPVYSWFLEVNNYLPNKNYVTYYDKGSPSKFVVKSNIEFLINLVVVIGALVSLVWLIIALV